MTYIHLQIDALPALLSVFECNTHNTFRDQKNINDAEKVGLSGRKKQPQVESLRVKNNMCLQHGTN